MILSPLQAVVLFVAVFYAGGLGWHFLARSPLAKKIGRFALFAAVTGIVWFILSRKMPAAEILSRAVPVIEWSFVLLIPVVPVVISLWVAGLLSARWLCQRLHSHPRSDAPPPPEN